MHPPWGVERANQDRPVSRRKGQANGVQYWKDGPGAGGDGTIKARFPVRVFLNHSAVSVAIFCFSGGDGHVEKDDTPYLQNGRRLGVTDGY